MEVANCEILPHTSLIYFHYKSITASKWHQFIFTAKVKTNYITAALHRYTVSSGKRYQQNIYAKLFVATNAPSYILVFRSNV